MKKNKNTEYENLRQKAEALLKKKAGKTASSFSEIEMLRVLHELEVHQIELELQNDELQRAKELADLATDKYNDLYDFAPSGYLTLSKNGDIVELNLESAKMLSSERSKLMNKRLELFVSSDTRSIFNQFLGYAFEGKRQETCEVALPNDGDLPTYALLTGILTKNNELCNVTMVDITERKQAEETLRESEKLLRTMAENYPNSYVSIIEKDLTIGYTAGQEFLNQNLDPNQFNGMQLEQVFGENSAFVKEKYLKSFDGTETQFELFVNDQHQYYRTVPLMNQDGRITRIMVVAENITERKQAEVEIAESLLSAKQANQVKDQFIANISHEIRTPLNSIIGFSDLFQQRYGKMVSEKDQGIFQFITNASDRLMRTVDAILNISQLNAGVIKIKQLDLDLNTIVRAVIGETKALADEKGLELTYSATDEFARVNVDNYSLHQAILNLIDNAIKYTNEGKIELSLIQKGDRFRLSIKDTGIGISEEYIKRIYDPYTQESEGFTKNYQGVGLGLALTKRYLELNGVDLELESEKNVGTTFTLIFPKYEGSDHV